MSKIYIFLSILFVLSIVSILIGGVYLFCTDRFELLLNLRFKELKKSLSNRENTVFVVLKYSIPLFTFIVQTLAGDIISNYFFPNSENQILDSLDKIRNNQEGLKEDNSKVSWKLERLITQAEIDVRDIRDWINKLPIDKGIENTIESIETHYQKRQISLIMKELLLVVVEMIFEYNNELLEKIEIFKLEGNSEMVLLFEEIHLAYLNQNTEEIIRLYENQEAKAKTKKVVLLREVIASLDAMFVVDKTIELYEELILTEPSLDNLRNFAFFSIRVRFLKRAEYCFAEMVKILEGSKRTSKINSQLIILLNNLGRVQMELGQLERARSNYTKSLRISQNFNILESSYSIHNYANTLLGLADLKKSENQYNEAASYYKKAIGFFEELVKKDFDSYALSLAIASNNFGLMNIGLAKYDIAQMLLDRALQIYDTKILNGFDGLRVYRASTLLNIGRNNSAQQLWENAETSYKGALSDYVSAKNFGVVPNQLEMSEAYHFLGIAQFRLKKYSEAENNLQFALNSYSSLASKKNQSYLIHITDVNDILSMVLEKMGRTAEVVKLNELLSKNFRELAKSSPQIYLPKLAGVLDYSHYYLYQSGKFENSKKKYEEAKNIYAELYKKEKYKYAVDYARMLTMGTKHFRENRANLIEAQKILKVGPKNKKSSDLLNVINKL